MASVNEKNKVYANKTNNASLSTRIEQVLANKDASPFLGCYVVVDVVVVVFMVVVVLVV